VQVGYFCPANFFYLKRFFLIVLTVCFWHSASAQNDTLPPVENDTLVQVPIPKPQKPVRKIAPAGIKKVTTLQPAADSSFKIDSFGLVSVDTTLGDTLKKPDTLIVKKFSGIDSSYARFLRNPFLPYNAKPVYQIVKLRQSQRKDDLFYLVAGLVFLLAFIKLFFSKYFANIFRLFFQPSFRQKQTREQLMQSSLPSFLLNLFFLFAAGIYSALLSQYYALIELGFWLLFLYCILGMLILYLGKFILLSFSGWVFNVKEASATYIFVVNLTNKILGVILLPFIFIIAFSSSQVVEVSVTISFMLVILLFFYRFAVSFAPVRREVSVSPLHFLMYILAFEIIPLLLIYKSLMLFLVITH
jgi:hypothetical protein